MHTIPNGNPPESFASNTELNGTILLPPITIDPEFRELKVSEEKTIHFHSLIPLYQEEMDLKLKKGAEALFKGFEEHNISELIDPARPNVAARKKRSWFPFGR